MNDALGVSAPHEREQLVGGGIMEVEPPAGQVIRLDGKKTEGRIEKPLDEQPAPIPDHLRPLEQGLPQQPFHPIARLPQGRRVRLGARDHAGLDIVEDVQIFGITGRVNPGIQHRASRQKTFRRAVGGQQTQGLGLECR